MLQKYDFDCYRLACDPRGFFGVYKFSGVMKGTAPLLLALLGTMTI
jgi:hypothetical protein